MFKVTFTENAYQGIDMYVYRYRSYFENLYKDTGVWEENTIIDNYIIESEERYFQIVDTIAKVLQDDIITYTQNETLIKWRSKILLVFFQEKENTRIITGISIR